MEGLDMGKAISIKDRIRSAGPVTKKVTVWLGADVTLVDEYEQGRDRLDELEKKGSPHDSAEGSPECDELRTRLQELRAQLDEYALTLKVRALSDDEWQRLVDEHPPRRKTDTDEADVRDAMSGWNTTTFPRALLRAATVDPQLDDDDWRLLLGDGETAGKLTSPQVDEAAGAAARITKYPISVPFS